jgi:hypothetical protein
VARVDDLLIEAIKAAGPKPDDSEPQAVKGPYSNRISNTLARAIAEELRQRGMTGHPPRAARRSRCLWRRAQVGWWHRRQKGRRHLGHRGIRATTGLLVKTIMFRDLATGQYQENLINRRGDLLIESTTLHRRFPYAVVAGFLFLDIGAASDCTPRRNSTFENAFPRLRLFTRRGDPEGREEQFERLYLLLVDANQFAPKLMCCEVNNRESEVELETAFDELIDLLAERNFDLYEAVGDGAIRRSP